LFDFVPGQFCIVNVVLLDSVTAVSPVNRLNGDPAKLAWTVTGLLNVAPPGVETTT
jgi:hypothetical protein